MIIQERPKQEFSLHVFCVTENTKWNTWKSFVQ